ncbi:hypothetical protein QBC44DRAFT_371877, partial [Cladorrhinum sp. PSN332]
MGSDFHFLLGTIKPGEWICSAARGMMMDPSVFANPGEFQGFRFADPVVLDKMDGKVPFPHPGGDNPSELTNIADWQLWGTGKCA